MLAIHIAWPIAGLVFILFLGEKITDDFSLMRAHPHQPDQTGSDRPGSD